MSRIVSDEVAFKVNGTVNHCNYVDWTTDNPLIHVGKVVNLWRLSHFERKNYWPY
jgi:hypothetical protein